MFLVFVAKKNRRGTFQTKKCEFSFSEIHSGKCVRASEISVFRVEKLSFKSVVTYVQKEEKSESLTPKDCEKTQKYLVQCVVCRIEQCVIRRV